MKEYNERGRRLWPITDNEKVRTRTIDPEELAKGRAEIRAGWEAELQEEQEKLASAPAEDAELHLRNIQTVRDRLTRLNELDTADGNLPEKEAA